MKNYRIPILILTVMILIAALVAFQYHRTRDDNNNNKDGTFDASNDVPDISGGTDGESTAQAVPTEPADTDDVTAEPVTEPPAVTDTETVDTGSTVVPPNIPYDGEMPVVRIDTGGVEVVSKKNYVACTVTITTKESTGNDGMESEPAQVRVRGNSSAFYGNEEKIRNSGGKVPYKIKFDSKTNVLGLNDGARFRDWVLLRAENDAGSIGNDVALRLGRAILDGDVYCADARFVHLYLNDVYLGIYSLTEQNEVKKYRVDVNEPDENSTDRLTGYYMQIENYVSGETVFRMNYSSATVEDVDGRSRAFKKVHYAIKSQINTDEQLEFIGNYMNNVFNIVYEACERGNYLAFDESLMNLVDGEYADAESAVAAVLDLDSVVNMYILYELLHDYDIGEGSFYMTVDLTPGVGDGLVKFTSPWDFDWICGGSATDRFWAATFDDKSFSEKYGERSNPWFIVLYKQDWFRARVSARWAELRASGAVDAALEEEREILKMYKKDFGDTYTANRIVKWITSRAEWLNEVW